MSHKLSDAKLMLLSFAVGTVLALGMFALIVALSSNRNQGVSNCNQIELLKSSIRRTIAVADAKIGLPGQPGFAYYRDHPGELAKAHALNQQSLLVFKPVACG